jgi:4'-phosphopantetheinyl transferase
MPENAVGDMPTSAVAERAVSADGGPRIAIVDCLLGDGELAVDLTAVLSREERTRAARRVPEAARRAVASRGRLRLLLGRLLDADPAAIELAAGPFGKPMLAGRWAERLHFNVSHAGDRWIVAVSPTVPVGVDLELRTERHTPAWAALMAGSILTEAEQLRALNRVDVSTLLDAWVAKEAVLKAIGTGIGDALRSLTLPEGLPQYALAADGSVWPAMLAELATPAAGGASLGVAELEFEPGVHAAIASAAGRCRLSRHAWGDALRNGLSVG